MGLKLMRSLRTTEVRMRTRKQRWLKALKPTTPAPGHCQIRLVSLERPLKTPASSQHHATPSAQVVSEAFMQ
jgi:hypothetical protein